MDTRNSGSMSCCPGAKPELGLGKDRRPRQPDLQIASSTDAFHSGKHAAGSRSVDVDKGGSRVAQRALQWGIHVVTRTYLAQLVDALIRLVIGPDRNQGIQARLLLGSGVVRPGPGNEAEDLWCASETERR